MQKKIFSFFLALSMFLVIGSGSAWSTIIDFSEVGLLTTDPTISGVSFFAGLPAGWNDTITDNGLSPTNNPYLLSGFDNGNAPGLYDTFIGASASGFTFDSVTFDIGILDGTLGTVFTSFYVNALSGGTNVASSTISFNDSNYHALSVSFATGFDTLHIYSEMNPSGLGEIFEIDNFNFTQYQGGGPGPEPIPEPGTMLLFGAGLMVFAALGRKKRTR